MPAEKRNHFLDIDESDDDDGSQGYDSEAEQLRKGTSKRRKLDQDDGSEDDEPLSADEALEEEEYDGNDVEEEEEEDAPEEDAGKPTRKDLSTSKDSSDLPDIARPLTKKNLVATEKAVKRSGVIYISRVPPFMKPGTVRSIFERFGKINRVYLTPEDSQVRARRLQQGQNRKKNFNEGWLEFIQKSDAKAAVESLNGTTLAAIGMAKKGSYYRDDIWSLRYLKGFKWHNLTEQIAAETAERQSRMRAEISKAAKENKEFVRNIQKAKELEGIQSKAAAKKTKEAEKTDTTATTVKEAETKSLRKFKQASTGRKGPEKTSAAAKRVLSQLF
ncbi:Pre-rRNA-processing protein ESF2 [Hypoxylon argillaceum]|nr:Pre-rRNA-processing protein ESF2 [Hypoxylon argillaceum]